ncbi:hypothetical protein Tco_0613778 [Tanacetum coccineum]
MDQLGPRSGPVLAGPVWSGLGRSGPVLGSCSPLIPPTPVTEPTSEPSSPSTAPEHETMEHPFEQPSPEHQPSSPRQESDIPQTQAPTHTHETETWHMSVDDLFQLLVKKVKKMEKVVKSRRVVLTDSGNSSKQGRNFQKDKSEVFETPKQGKSSGETDISPQDQSAGPADQAEDQPSSSKPLPSSSHPLVKSPTIASESRPVAEPTTHHTSPSHGPDNEPT